MGFLDEHGEHLIFLTAALAGIGWICVVCGFAIENDNPNRLTSDGWDKHVEKFTWYVYCILGALALLLMTGYAVLKRRGLLGAGLTTAAVAMLFMGGAMDESGHFVWNCHQKEATNGQTFTGPGCQEQTYHNYAMVFSGTLIFGTFMAVAICVAVLTTEAETHKNKLVLAPNSKKAPALFE